MEAKSIAQIIVEMFGAIIMSLFSLALIGFTSYNTWRIAESLAELVKK